MTSQVGEGVVMYPDRMTAYERGGGAKTIRVSVTVASRRAPAGTTWSRRAWA